MHLHLCACTRVRVFAVSAHMCVHVERRQLWDGAVGANGAAGPVVLQGLSRARTPAAASPVLGLGCQDRTRRASGKASALRHARGMLQPSLRRSPLKRLLTASINDIHPISRCELCLARRISKRNHHPKA